MPKNILVTGGAGFIGSHIVDRYLSLGHRVAVVDNLQSGSRKNLNKKATFYKIDIRNQKQLEAVFKKEQPDIVNHHAAKAEVSKSIRDPASTIDINVNGTVNVLSAFSRLIENGVIRHTQKPKFIFASSGGAIYGEPKKIPVSEALLPEPISPYGLSKLLAEKCVEFYSRVFGFTHVILRYANVYGPRQNPRGEAGVVAIFSDLLRRGKTPTIFGDGTKIRDYVYVADIVRANVAALSYGRNGVFNLGVGRPIRDQDVFDAIAAHFNKKEVIYFPFRKGEIRKITLDSRRASRFLRWKPMVSFEEGIKRTVGGVL